MTRFGYVLACATFGLGAALFACGGSDGGSGGVGGGGQGGVLPGTGGSAQGTGGAVQGTGGAVVGTGGAVSGNGGAVVGTGGGGGGAGGGGTDAVLAIIPGDKTIGDWERDPSDKLVKGKVAAIALDSKAAITLIDGGAEPFYTSQFGPTVFAWQNYMNTTLNPPDGYFIRMYLLQMPSADQAAALYTSLVDGTHSLYTSTLDKWDETVAVGADAARIVNSGTDWWINFRKGVYYVELSLSYAERTDQNGKAEVISFAKELIKKM